MTDPIQEERDRLQREIQLSKKLLTQNLVRLGAKPSNGLSAYIAENPFETFYMIDNLSHTLLPDDHKINSTIRGIRQGVVIADQLMS